VSLLTLRSRLLAHTNLGGALEQTPGRLPDAIAEYRTTLRIAPDFAEGHYNLGEALARIPRRLPEAAAPDFPPARELRQQLRSGQR
jgi:tetratricopeptide (TPR) repeat protein